MQAKRPVRPSLATHRGPSQARALALAIPGQGMQGQPAMVSRPMGCSQQEPRSQQPPRAVARTEQVFIGTLSWDRETLCG